jgi:PadR family transcriptional regulator, regulatory protein AphA
MQFMIGGTMSIEYAILGLLSWRPLSGYDLKKMFQDSVALYWSGNNNEIYRTLVNLHKQGQVSMEVLPQENLPARKIYTITEKGGAELKKWLLKTTDLPQVKHTLLIQLAWADQLSAPELDGLLARYEDELTTQFWLSQSQGKQKIDARAKPHQVYLDVSQARTEREAYLWGMIQQNWTSYYENELAWLRKLRFELANH